jgi:hypothetical protein
VAATPIRNDGASAGIFSIAFSAAARGIVVGGDYSKDKEDRGNIAISNDGGRTWTAPAAGPIGFRSAIVWVPERKLWIASGTSGSDVSNDDGRTWRQFDEGSFHTLSVAPGGAVWAAGARGRIARLQWSAR